MVAFLLVGAALAAVAAYCTGVIQRLIRFFQNNLPAVLSSLEKAASLMDMVNKYGMKLTLEDSRVFRNAMHQINSHKGKELLLRHSQVTLHTELIQMEESMEAHLTPEPEPEGGCVVM